MSDQQLMAMFDLINARLSNLECALMDMAPALVSDEFCRVHAEIAGHWNLMIDQVKAEKKNAAALANQ